MLAQEFVGPLVGGSGFQVQFNPPGFFAAIDQTNGNWMGNQIKNILYRDIDLVGDEIYHWSAVFPVDPNNSRQVAFSSNPAF